jgi:hypothetical protein
LQNAIAGGAGPQGVVGAGVDGQAHLHEQPPQIEAGANRQENIGGGQQHQVQNQEGN